jgi:hypothetical protein
METGTAKKIIFFVCLLCEKIIESKNICLFFVVVVCFDEAKEWRRSEEV